MGEWRPKVESFFHTFLDQSPLAAWIVDGEDRLVYSSEPWPLREEQVGMPMWDWVPEPYVAPYRAALERARSTGETQVVTAPGPRGHDAATGEGWFQAHYFALSQGWVGGVAVDVTDLVTAHAELVESRQRLVAAGDLARRRIERDLHDGVQQRLIVQLLRLRAIRQSLPDDPAKATDLLDEALADLQDAVDELRELARGIHPSTLTRAGLKPALADLVARMPFPVRLTCPLQGRLPEPVEVAAYFLCSEALTNMVKHSAATCGEVTVSTGGDAVVVEVRDDGVGGVTEVRGGGLEGLRDRVEALRGSLSVREADGGGTVVRAQLPI